MNEKRKAAALVAMSIWAVALLLEDAWAKTILVIAFVAWCLLLHTTRELLAWFIELAGTSLSIFGHGLGKSGDKLIEKSSSWRAKLIAAQYKNAQRVTIRSRRSQQTEEPTEELDVSKLLREQDDSGLSILDPA